ncbi:hypothetical protein GCM10023147_41990 [Tsukamurella soli]|uniref:HTH cro/C1-type domain-containing protein n=1 Tax=Tsukamurella soli TaxID=644556 RepID=A0ABP8K880_9ACTN
MADFLPTHPGILLRTEFLEPLGISQYALAKATGLPLPRINAIANGRRSITADTGLRLARALGLSEMFWINMQARYDADIARSAHADELLAVTPLAGRSAAGSTAASRTASTGEPTGRCGERSP